MYYPTTLHSAAGQSGASPPYCIPHTPPHSRHAGHNIRASPLKISLTVARCPHRSHSSVVTRHFTSFPLFRHSPPSASTAATAAARARRPSAAPPPPPPAHEVLGVCKPPPAKAPAGWRPLGEEEAPKARGPRGGDPLLNAWHRLWQSNLRSAKPVTYNDFIMTHPKPKRG